MFVPNAAQEGDVMNERRYILCTGENYAYMEVPASVTPSGQRALVQPISAYLYSKIADGTVRIPMGKIQSRMMIPKLTNDIDPCIDKKHVWRSYKSVIIPAVEDEMKQMGFS